VSPSEEPLGEGTAERVLQIALANLPLSYGSAIHGTAEESRVIDRK